MMIKFTSSVALIAALVSSSTTTTQAHRILKDDSGNTHEAAIRELRGRGKGSSLDCIPVYGPTDSGKGKGSSRRLKRSKKSKSDKSKGKGKGSTKEDLPFCPVCFTLDGAKVAATALTPVTTDGDVSTYYAYNTVADNRSFNGATTPSGGIYTVLHQDSTTGLVSLVVVAGSLTTGSPPASGSLALTGVGDASVAPGVIDDTSPPSLAVNADPYLYSATTGAVNFDFVTIAERTDGLAMPLLPTDLEVGDCATLLVSEFTGNGGLAVDVDGMGMTLTSFQVGETINICLTECP